MADPKIAIVLLDRRLANHIKFFWAFAALIVVWLGGISALLFNMNGEIAKLRLPQRLEQSAITPQNPKSQTQAVSILKEAQRTATTLPESYVQRAGTRFVEVSQTDSSAWQVALEFVSYRSSLNVNSLDVGTARDIATTPLNADLETHYELSLLPKGYSIGTITVGGDVPSEQAATMYKLTSNPPDYKSSRGKQVILIEGGAVELDQMFMRHVVIRNATVFYSSAPMVLQDVVFVHCVFVMENKPDARTLALSVLAESSVSFHST